MMGMTMEVEVVFVILQMNQLVMHIAMHTCFHNCYGCSYQAQTHVLFALYIQ